MADKDADMKKSWLWAEMIAWVLFLFIMISLLVGCGPKVDPKPIEADYITVKVYWASFCPYCIEELAVLEEISQELVGHPYLEGKVEIIAANVDLTGEELQMLLQDIEYSFTMTSGEYLPRWAKGFPAMVIRDREGVAKFQWTGLANKAQLYSMIMETLGYSEVI